MDTVTALWQQATAVYPTPSPWVVLAAAVLATATIVVRSAWIRARHAVTIAHEGGHALAALLTGRRLVGIRLHSDTSGLTVSRGAQRGPGMVLTALAGYPAPALLGLAAAALLRSGYVVGLLMVLLALLIPLLLMVRNGFGLWSILLTGAIVAAAVWLLPVPWQGLAAYSVAWFLLLAAPRAILDLIGQRRRTRDRESDAALLARLTPLPAGLWVAVMMLSTLAALVVGTGWLLPALPVA